MSVAKMERWRITCDVCGKQVFKEIAVDEDCLLEGWTRRLKNQSMCVQVDVCPECTKESKES